jgi:hypothetical protein
MDTPQQQVHRLLTLVPELSREEVVALVPLVAALQSALGVQLLLLPHALPASLTLLTVTDAARHLGVTQKWLYKRVATLPFTIHDGHRWYCSEAGMRQWLASRNGDPHNARA